MTSDPTLSRRTFSGAAGAALVAATARVAVAAQSPATDVRTFDAAGDGSRNDTAALEAALRASNIIYVPAGTYLVDRLVIPSGRTIRTDGFSTIFRQRPGTADGTRLLEIVGSNVEVEDCTLEGNIASDAGEQHHGIFVEAKPAVGNLSNIVIGNVRGRNLRGDVVYIGSANGAVAKEIRVGQVYGLNILRNVVSIVGGFSIAVESVRGSNVGYTHLDIEPDSYNGPVVGCTIGSVHGTFVQLAGQTSEASVDRIRIGLLDLIGTVQQSVPPYGPGAARIDALTLRNVRSLEIGRFIARGFEGAAIRQIWNSGALTEQRVHIAAAELSDNCRRQDKAHAYIQGDPRATRLSIDSLAIDIPRQGVDGVRDCKEAHIRAVQGNLARGSRLIAQAEASPEDLFYVIGGGAALYGIGRFARGMTK